MSCIGYIFAAFVCLAFMTECEAGFNMQAQSSTTLVEGAEAISNLPECEPMLYEFFCEFRADVLHRRCTQARDLLQSITDDCETSDPVLRVFQDIQYANLFRYGCSETLFPTDDCDKTTDCLQMLFSSTRSLLFKCDNVSTAASCYDEAIGGKCKQAEALKALVIDSAAPLLCPSHNTLVYESIRPRHCPNL